MSKRNESIEDTLVALTQDLTAVVQQEIGMKEIFATQMADALVRGLRKRMGGQDLYIPAEDKTERDAHIRKEFNGRNIDEMCKKFSLSKRSIYKIVERKP